jgi:hypothetical protein
MFKFTGIAEEITWQPTDVAGCVLWLRSDLAWQDAAKTVPCVADQDLIYVGPDKSTNHNDVIQETSGFQPKFYTNQIHGHPAWRFDGGDDYLKAAPFILNQPCEVYMVVKMISWAGAYTYYFDGDTIVSMGTLQDIAAQMSQYANGWGAYIPFSVGSWALIQSRFGTTPLGSLLRINGGSPVTATVGAATPAGFTLGARGDLIQNGNIDVAEAVIYSPPLGDTDRQRLELYFNTESQGTGYALY